MSPATASVSPRPPTAFTYATTHAKNPSISSTATSVASAAPPSKAEIERKLSVKLAGVPPTRKPTRKGSAVSAAESDTSNNPGAVAGSPVSTTLPPLITSSLGFGGGGHFSTSPVGTTPTTPAPHGHGPLSAIAERRTARERTGETTPPPDELDEDESDLDEGEDAELERGMDGERIFKSGFLIKKQERRKVWKKKWFVLRATKLAYYKDNREYSLSRAIDLRQVHSVVPVASEKQKHPFAFAIVTSDRNFMVEALSAEERDDWVRAINNVRKRMSVRDEEEAVRRQQAAQILSKPLAVPPAPTDQHDEPHHGTWTSTFSNTTGMSVSPAASTSGAHFRSAGPSSWHPPPSHAQGPSQLSQSPYSGTSHGNANLARSPSTATAPSAAMVNRRLSNPIPIPNYQPKPPQLNRIPSVEQNNGVFAGLSPPNMTPHFVSSDEDEPYFSDPNAAWPENPQPAVVQPSTPDPNQVILAMYLMKKSRKTTRQVWRKRWFFLTPAGITYSKSHMDPRPLRFIPIKTILDVFSVDADDDDDDDVSSGQENARSVQRHTSMRTKREPAPGPKPEEHVVRIVCTKRRFDLCAPSEEEEIKWTAAIRALINRERGRQAGNGSCAAGPEGATPAVSTGVTKPAAPAVPAAPAAPAPPSQQAQPAAPAQPAPPQAAPITIPTISQVPPTPHLVTIPSPTTTSTDSPTSVTAPRRGW